MDEESLIARDSLQLAELIARAMEDGKQLNGFSAAEILARAAKHKRTALIRAEAMPGIEAGAEQAYQNALGSLSATALAQYIEARQRAKSGEVSKLAPPLDDTEFKRHYIEKRIGLTENDTHYVRAAIEEAASRKVHEEYARQRKLHHQRGSVLAYDQYLELRDMLLHSAASKLYNKALEQYLLELPEQPLRLLVYKCLRFTHADGEPNMCPTLDDYVARDLNGTQAVFLGAADQYQLERVEELQHQLASTQGIDLVVLVSDFDIHKFGAEHARRLEPSAQQYRELLAHSYPALRVELETAYLGTLPGFDETCKEVVASLAGKDGQYMHPAEFERAHVGYQEAFANTLKDWSSARSREYALRSVSRNIATGIALGAQANNYATIVFNTSTVNGERMNLASAKHIPCIALEKPKSRMPLGSTVATPITSQAECQ